MIAVSITKKPGALTMLADGWAEKLGRGEIFVRGALNKEKADFMEEVGHDIFQLPEEVRVLAVNTFRLGLRTFNVADGRRLLHAAAKVVAKWLQMRITSGQLGEQSWVTAKIKMWLITHPKSSKRKGVVTTRERCTVAYGLPPPLGIRTGKMVASISTRWRE
jgi:hypothetical protein